MSTVTIDEAWPGFGGPFTVAELDRMPSDGHRYELADGACSANPVSWLTDLCPRRNDPLSAWLLTHTRRRSGGLVSLPVISQRVPGSPRRGRGGPAGGRWCRLQRGPGR